MIKSKLMTHLKNKDHVIWDWNGTLLNDVDHAIQVMNRILEAHGLPLLDKKRYQEIFDFPIRKYYDALGFDYDKESFESLCHRFVEGFMCKVDDLALFSEVEQTVRELKQLGVQQSVLSATDQENLDQMISHFGLRDAFTHVFGIENKLAASKLERGRGLLKLSKVPAHRTAMVGDTIHDLEVANELGIDAVLISHGHQSESRLKQRHHLVVSEEIHLRDKIELHPYTPAWQAKAASEIDMIKKLVPKLPFSIEHIGSTAIPGLAAKPIIDLMIGTSSIEDAAQMIAPLESIGYSFWREDPNKQRLYFVKGLPAVGGAGRTHHIHVVEKSSQFWHEHLLFRDFLRANPAIARDYENLKLQLADKFPDDREAYTKGKAAFIAGILERAPIA